MDNKDNSAIENIINRVQEGNGILGSIKIRYDKGLLNLIKVIGLPGTGKSWACMRLAELISLEIHKENRVTINNVVDNLLNLLKFIRSVKARGEILIIEEAEVLFPSRRAMSGDNVDAIKIFDTIRKKGIIVIMNYPLNKSVDSRIDAMTNLQLETMKLYKKLGICIVKPLKMQTNPASGKIYMHKVWNKGREVNLCYFNKPDEKITIDYEANKDAFLEELYEHLEHKQEQKKKLLMKEMGKVEPRQIMLKPTVKELEAYTACVVNGRSLTEYAQEEGVAPAAIHYRLKNLKKKTKLLEKTRDLNLKQAPLAPQVN